MIQILPPMSADELPGTAHWVWQFLGAALGPGDDADQRAEGAKRSRPRTLDRERYRQTSDAEERAKSI